MFSEEIEYGKFCFLMRSAVFRDKYLPSNPRPSCIIMVQLTLSFSPSPQCTNRNNMPWNKFL